ncbi:hypothetical protein [Xenophilus sp. Marseille-Q4582]|uniref:hypothetical protein n=1 Tax=Xenophilus sp. Marseille-Q4582 TaxID=2866600 RepID=UPI001CE45898|nr:hypothetical protein [Xenophilus sp. Marseille-Q4582]
MPHPRLPIPGEWAVSFSLSKDGGPHFATVTRGGMPMCRLSISGPAVDEATARRDLQRRAEAWIRGHLARAG